MQPVPTICALSLILSFVPGCSRTEQERARERAAEARDKMRTEAHKLATETREQAHKLNQEIDQAGIKASSRAETDQKLDDAKRTAQEETVRAGQKLGRAALIAKVKTSLVADVGLSTASAINVDAVGDVITLRGTVSSEDQKREAERVASQVDGVASVVNKLTVEP